MNHEKHEAHENSEMNSFRGSRTPEPLRWFPHRQSRSRQPCLIFISFDTEGISIILRIGQHEKSFTSRVSGPTELRDPEDLIFLLAGTSRDSYRTGIISLIDGA